MASDVVERINTINRWLDLAVGIGELTHCSVCGNQALRLVIEQLMQEIEYQLGDDALAQREP